MTEAVATATVVPALPTRVTVVGGGGRKHVRDAAALRVLLITEGTYPYAWGGVSTWCDSLIEVLPDVEFHVVSIVAEPDMRLVFDLPSNVRSVSTVPLWGVQNVKETWGGLTRRDLRASRAASSPEAVSTEFVPALSGFLSNVLTASGNVHELAEQIHAIYRYLRQHDLVEAMQSAQVWAAYADIMEAAYRAAADELALPELELWELTTGMQWVTRWLFALAADIPPVDVVHAAMAGVCSVVAAAAKLEHGAGFLLTEHGVYLRERYIFEAARTDSYFLKLLGLRFARRTTELSYAIADQISPCCDYNQRWELEVGAVRGQLETIYYGVDPEAFSAERPVSALPRVVVWVGRINPLKDVETLLRAAADTVRERPDVQFLLYGGAPDEDAAYYQRCLALHEELQLGESVKFCGFTDNPAAAYNSGDLVVLSSISEGFPYSTLEAMLCGRPVVATAVGGLSEQIGPAGTVVEPRDGPAMATAILDILNDPKRCAALGVSARARALGKFGHSKFRATHLTAYRRLSAQDGDWRAVVVRPGAAAAAQTSPSALLPQVSEAAAGSLRDEREAARANLAAEVLLRSPVPMDPLEVAAVLESMGLTDGLARRRYGEEDVFALATALFRAFTQTRRESGPAKRTRPAARTNQSGAGLFDPARHPAWALLPSLALITSIWVLSTMGRWHGTRAISLTIGMSAGMLSTNGIALAMGRRGSVSLSLGKLHAARRFFMWCLGVSVAWAAGLTLALSLIPWPPIYFLAQDRVVFVTAAVVLSVIWITAAALSLVAATGWSGIAMSAGVLAAVGADRLLAIVTSRHAVFATATGVAVIVSGMLGRLDFEARRRTQQLTTSARLPSRAYLVEEGTPYFLYGTLGVVMFVTVHVVGWAHVQGEQTAVTTLELGLVLPLLPAVLGAGHAERVLRAFWDSAEALQHATFARARANFGAKLYGQYRIELRRYVSRLVRTSVLTVVMVEPLIDSHLLHKVADYRSKADVRLLFYAGLVAYALIAVAQFNCMFALSLNRLRGPLRSVTAGIAVTFVASVVLAAFAGFALMGLALACGAAVYALLSFRNVSALLASADLHYVAAA
ncbi:MAG: GT4 family glycosyltransferase PelF [Actinomycetota bacterium]